MTVGTVTLAKIFADFDPDFPFHHLILRVVDKLEYEHSRGEAAYKSALADLVVCLKKLPPSVKEDDAIYPDLLVGRPTDHEYEPHLLDHFLPNHQLYLLSYGLVTGLDPTDPSPDFWVALVECRQQMVIARALYDSHFPRSQYRDAGDVQDALDDAAAGSGLKSSTSNSVIDPVPFDKLLQIIDDAHLKKIPVRLAAPLVAAEFED